MLLKPTQMVGLGRIGGGELETVRAQVRDGKVTDKPALGAQHRAEAEATNLRNAPGHDPIQECFGALTCH